jgi:Cathepsin propeptide inhibitor domain (I29)
MFADEESSMRGERTPLLGSNAETSPAVNKKGQPSYLKYAAAVTVLGALSLVAVSYKPRPAVHTLALNRIKQAQEGAILYGELEDKEVEMLFGDFKEKFSKAYEHEEEEKTRLHNFKKFLSKVDERNQKERALGGSAVHGVTKFSDLSNEEFRAGYLGYKRPTGKEAGKKNYADIEEYTGEETRVDWTDMYTTGVASQVESDAIRAGYLTPDDKLSEQQIVSW